MASGADITLTSNWQRVIGAGGLVTPDNGGARVTNPLTQIALATSHLLLWPGFSVAPAAGKLTFRVGRDPALTGIGSPVFNFFRRRTNSGNAFQGMKNLLLAASIMCACEDTDPSDGTYLYSIPDAQNHELVIHPDEEVLIGLETALSGATGTVATAFLEARVIR